MVTSTTLYIVYTDFHATNRPWHFLTETQKIKEGLKPPNKNSSDPDSITQADAELESIIDMRILDMLRLLEEYRRYNKAPVYFHYPYLIQAPLNQTFRKCIEVDDDYIEAKRAEDKFVKTLEKATKKQRAQIRNFQEKELESIEVTQKQQFKEFSDTWDEYMCKE